MDVEFLRPDDEQKLVLATATWDGRDVAVAGDDEDLLAVLRRALRRSRLVLDDGAYRRIGTSGSVLVPPGDITWFRAAATPRATAESGLLARVVPGRVDGGYDPAAGYRRFDEQLERLDARARG